MTEIYRRRFITITLGMVTPPLLAGCLGNEDEDENEYDRGQFGGIEARLIDEVPPEAPITDSTQLPLEDYPALEPFLDRASNPGDDHHPNTLTRDDCELDYMAYLESPEHGNPDDPFWDLPSAFDDVPSFDESESCYLSGMYIQHKETLLVLRLIWEEA